MKKLIPFILISLLVLSMTGCAVFNAEPEASVPEKEEAPLFTDVEEEASEEADEEPSKEPAGESAEPESTPADVPADENTVITEVTVPDISENEVQRAYADCIAFRDYWFRGGNADIMLDETVELDGVTYWRYSAVGIDSFEEFKETALKLVSEEIFSAWQENYTYIGHEGKLYGPMNYGAGDQDGFSHIEAECVQLSEEEYELKVGEYYFAEYITGEEGTVLTGEYTCNYDYVDGRWVFTAFSYQPVSNFAG